MAHNKLENQIKEKLNAREIQPSAQAWDRLDAMLSVAEEKKTKRSFFSFKYIGIAASALVFVTLVTLFFNQKKAEIINNATTSEVKKDTVETPNTKLVIPNPIKEQNKEVVVSTESKPQNRNSQLVNNKKASIINQKTLINNQVTENQKQSDNSIINRDKEIEFLISSDVAQKTMPKIYNQKEIIVNPVQKQINKHTDEQLIKSLENAAISAADKASNFKVDAKSLLSQVDGELEHTFREKVINKVTKNYKEVKVALANRNNK